MSNINQSSSIIKKEELENGSMYIEYDDGLITFESPIEYFVPEYNRHMSQREYDYLQKKKYNDKLLEKYPAKDKEVEKTKKL